MRALFRGTLHPWHPSRADFPPELHHAGWIQRSSRRRRRRHAHPLRARPRRVFARRQPGHVHRGAAGAGGEVPHRRRAPRRRHRRRGAQALQGLQPGARVRVVVGPRSGDARHRHAARLRHRPRRDDLGRDEDRARARWTAGIAGGFDTVSDPPIVYSREYQQLLLRAFRGTQRLAAHQAVLRPAAAAFQAGDARRARAAHRAFDGRTLRADGEDLEDLARRPGCARESQPRERRQGLGARLLQRPGGRRIPGPQDRQQRARRQHGGEARRSSSRPSTGAAARARSRPAIPRRSPTAPRRCCWPARNGRARATCRCSRISATASSGRWTTSAARKAC